MADKVITEDPEEKAKIGRPTTYTKELGDKICEKIVEGNSLRTITTWKGMPASSTVFKWLREDDDFSEQYARACEERTEAFAEDILDIADQGVAVVKAGAEKKSGAIAQMVKLQVDTRKWHMSKMKPKKYGESVDLTSGHKPLKSNVIVFTDFSKPSTAPSSAPPDDETGG